MLNHNIKGTGIGVTPLFREYVTKKLGHVEKFTQNDSTAHADIELEHKAQGRSKQYRAEFTLSLKGEVYRANAWGVSMYEAIDVAIGELTESLRQIKKVRLHTLRRSAARVKEYLRGWRRDL